MNTICAIVLASLTWYPSTNWVERPDPVASPHAKKGGVLRFNGSQSPKSYNAYIDNNTYTKMTFDLMYENLLTVDAETLDFEPGLARRWAVSDDGREYTFVLDERARWSDGQPITADDVKWTFDVVMDPKSDTGPFKTMLGVFESPEIIDTRTVKFRKKGDLPKDWRDILHCGLFWILPKHAMADKDFNKASIVNAPVSSAYYLARIEAEVESEFQRNPNWWRKDFPSSVGIFNFDRIIMRYYMDNENAFEALKKKAIDVYPVYTARIMNQETKGPKFEHNWLVKRRVTNHEPIGFQGFAMNMRRPPFNNLKVRQAMAKLVDRETMNRTMMNGEYFLLNSYYTDLYDAKHPCENTVWTYDVEGAKKLLKEAGYENGFEFTFLSRAASEDKFLSLFNHALSECGITMHIVRKDFAGWMRDMDAFNFDMTWASWGAVVFRNPETTWHSKEGKRNGGNNVTGLDLPELDALIAAEKLMATNAEREDAYRKMDKLITDALPYVLLWQTNEHRLLYWNKFGMPDTILSRNGDEDGIMPYWWYDIDRVEELKKSMENDGYLPSVPIRVDFDDKFKK